MDRTQWASGCDTHQMVALNIVRRLEATPVHELEQYMRCKDCSEGATVRAQPSAPEQDLQLAIRRPHRGRGKGK
jgi:hypothetical protein